MAKKSFSMILRSATLDTKFKKGGKYDLFFILIKCTLVFDAVK